MAARKPPNERSENLIFPLFFHGYCVRAPLAGDLRSTSPPWLNWSRLGAVSVPSWRVLGASLVRLGASWGRLGHQKSPHGRPNNLIFHRFFKVFVPVRLLRAILAQHSLPDRLGAVFGSSWGVFGSSWGVLGTSWRHLGASWGRLGASWGRLGPSWGPLGPSWGRLGPSWGGFWHPSRAKWGGPGGPGVVLGQEARRNGSAGGGRRCGPPGPPGDLFGRFERLD